MANLPTGNQGNSSDQALPGARGVLTVLMLLNLLNYIDRQILAAVVPYIKQEFFAPGVSHGYIVDTLLGWLGSILGSHNPENALVGLLAMSFMVSYMFMAPIFGALPVRRWRIVAVSAALWSLATGGCGLATTFGALLFRRALVGVGEAGYGPIAPTIIADYYPVRKRTQVLAWFYAAIPVGSALGFILAGVVSQYWGWRMAFLVAVPPGLLLAGIAWFMKDPKVGGVDAAAGGANAVPEKKMSQFAAYKSLLRNPSYVLCTLGMAAMTFAIGGLGFWIPDYVHSVRGQANLASVNMTFGVILVVSGLGATLLGGWLADYLRNRLRGSYFLVSAIAMLLGFPCIIAMQYAPFPLAWVFAFLACFFLFFNTGPTNAILINVTKPSIRPAAMALNILVTHALGDVISPLVIGAVTDATGSMDTAFTLVSVTMLIGGVLWLIGIPFLARDTAKVTPHVDNGR